MVTPYYQDPYVTIFQGDAKEILPTLPTPDLIIADPPYDLWGEFVDLVFSPKIPVAAFCSFQYRGIIETVMGRPNTEIIWHFPVGRWISHHLPLLTHSSILVYSDNLTGESAYVGDPINDKTPIKKGFQSIGNDYVRPDRVYHPRDNQLLKSVITAPKDLTYGSWSKPLTVMTPLIEWLSTPGQLIIDPFMGSGSAIRAAANIGRKAIGIELDESRCEIAATRMSQRPLL